MNEKRGVQTFITLFLNRAFLSSLKARFFKNTYVFEVFVKKIKDQSVLFMKNHASEKTLYVFRSEKQLTPQLSAIIVNKGIYIRKKIFSEAVLIKPDR